MKRSVGKRGDEIWQSHRVKARDDTGGDMSEDTSEDIDEDMREVTSEGTYCDSG